MRKGRRAGGLARLLAPCEEPEADVSGHAQASKLVLPT